MSDNELKNFLLEQKDKMPAHVAIIMDGNGRWAKARGLERKEGHKEGAKRVRPILETCLDLGIPNLTVFAFSTENWQRPEDEVLSIMKLLDKFLDEEVPELIENEVRLRFLGDHGRMMPYLKDKMEKAESETAKKYSYNLNICLNYGARAELTRAVKHIADHVASGKLKVDEIDDDLISGKLYTAGMPDPDLLIRTGGESRVSNYLLWQIAYAEITIHNKLWPDFYPEDFMECLRDYLDRDRRYGKIKE